MDKKYTPEFIDHSWDQMSQMLDKEMPQKKKRRFPYFFLLAGIALLVTAFFVYPLLSSKNDPTPLVAKTQNNDLQNASNDSRNTSNGISTTLNSEVINITTQENVSVTNPDKQSNELLKIKKNVLSLSDNQEIVNTTKSKNSNYSLEQTIYNSKDINIQNSADLVVTSDVVITSIQSEKSTTVSKTLTSSVSNLTSDIKRSLSLLALLDNKILLLENTDRLLPPLQPVVASVTQPMELKKTFDRWKFGIGAVYTSNFEAKVHGAGAIGRADFLFSKNWSLEGGLGIFYHSVHRNGNSDEDAANVFEDDTNGTMPDPHEFVDLEDNEENRRIFSNYLSNIKSQVQLVSQLGLKRSFDSNLFLSAGLKYRWNVSRSIEPLNDNLAAGIGVGPEDFETDLVSTYLRDQFYAPYIGLGYHFSNRFLLRGEVDLSSLSYLTTSSNSLVDKRTSYIQAEVVYRF